MGQAKLRGTFAQRQAAAFERQREDIAKAEERRQQRILQRQAERSMLDRVRREAEVAANDRVNAAIAANPELAAEIRRELQGRKEQLFVIGDGSRLPSSLLAALALAAHPKAKP